MLMQIAIARDGFIDINESPNFAQNDNFLDCLKKIFNFEEKDLYDFNGNTCRLINSYDPTNSIFIYTNQQGTFLYTITSATPYIHKNNMVWNCQTYKMEDLAKIDEVINNNLSQAVIYKNIAPSKLFFTNENGNKNNKANAPQYVVSVKDNFKTQSIYRFNMVYSRICCLKLKFLVNPTTNTNLKTKETDGSFNFFFPFYCGTKDATENDLFPLVEPTFRIINGSDTTQYMTMQDIISKYSANIKSIEILPFNPFASLGANVTISGLSTESVTTTINSGATFTDAGIFCEYGHSINRVAEDLITSDLSINSLKRAILLGGGAKGNIKTPLATLNLNFDGFRLTNENGFYYLIKSDGWKVDGIFEVDIPPHFLNFYTDNAGQVFIQNMTTNAQELRNITRNFDAKQEDLEQNHLLKQTLNATGTAIKALETRSPAGIIGGVGQALNIAVQTEFEKAQIERDYNRSLIEYNDKIQTQSLLAKMTGKQISGNSLLSDLISNFSANDFVITIELNTELKLMYSEDGSKIWQFNEVQTDYDYSTQYLKNGKIFLEDYFTILLNKTGEGFLSPYKYRYTYQLFGNLFGFSSDGYTNNEIITFYDDIGLNYNVVFKIKKLFNEAPTSAKREKLIETKILKFPIRHQTRISL